MSIFDFLENKSKDELYPMIDFLDSSVNRTDFVKYVDLLTAGVGIGLEENGCDFPNDLDEYALTHNRGFEGIRFYSFDEKISVDVPTFRKYLRIACEVYWQKYPESKTQLEEYMSRPQPPLEEGTLEEWKRRKAAGEYPKPYSEFGNN